MSVEITYYNELEDARAKLIKLIQAAEARAKTAHNFTETNFATTLQALYERMRTINRLLSAHKFLRMTRDEFLLSKAGKIEYYRLDTRMLNAHETLLMLSQRENRNLDELQSINNITTLEAAGGTTLKIKNTEKDVVLRFDNVMTFDSHAGNQVLGKDLNNSLSGNEEKDDFNVTSFINTIRQQVKNMLITQQGEYVSEEQFGIPRLGTNQNEQILTTKIIDMLQDDARIETVESIDVDKRGDELHVSATIKTINGDRIAV